MIRTQLMIPCAALALVVASLSFGSAPQRPQADPELEALKAEVESLNARVEAMEAFAEAQAAAGAELMTALAQSEAKGFTAGINPESREVLLAGLRASAEAMQAGADEDEDEEEPAARGDRNRRRRGR